MGAISVSGVCKSFGGSQILHDVDLQIAKGEFLTLLGPSGCGKSTLLRVIAGLEAPDRGRVEIAGRCVDDLRPAERNVAMVFQSYALYPYMTARQNIALPLLMRELTALERLPLAWRLLPRSLRKRREIEGRVLEVAETLGLSGLLDRRPGQLSGGQRQRVALGRAIVRDPAAFLMDEPLSNLDAKLRIQMRSEIAALHERLGTTFLYVTHDQAEAMTMSDRVAVMLDGQILQLAEPGELYSNPDDVRVAEFVGSPAINLLPGRLRHAQSVDCAGSPLALPGAVELAAGSDVTIGIRPESLAIAANAGPAINGVVARCENLGSDVFVYVDVNGLAKPVVARLGADALARVRAGAPISLTASAASLLVFGPGGRRLRARDQQSLVRAVP